MTFTLSLGQVPYTTPIEIKRIRDYEKCMEELVTGTTVSDIMHAEKSGGYLQDSLVIIMERTREDRDEGFKGLQPDPQSCL